MNSWMGRYLGRDLEGSLGQELLSPCSWGVPLSCRVDMFIDLLVVDQTLYKWDFYRDFITEE